ncbi:ral guanine nucleotide dissociation stimulator-like [Castor canadensis]|uniref:Ral guanine nucleotide dissociation stimulator-like n=1 Tax=Castor canadensis TaxID=51338 RepID=A0AC58MFS4_CASCN
MFSRCVQYCEGSGQKTSDNGTFVPSCHLSLPGVPVITHRVTPQPCRLWRFSQKMPKATQSEKELAPTLPNPCKAGTLKSGTLKVLVDHLVPSFLFGDPSYVIIFLFTYRSFADTHQVLNLLFDRYACVLLYSSGNDGPREQLKEALSFILGTWLNQYAEDFVQPPDFLCLKQLVAYLHINMPGSEEECQARLLLTHLENLQLSNMEPVALSPGAGLRLKPTPQMEPSQAPVLKYNPMASPASGLEQVRRGEEKPYILAFRPELVAERLTLMDAEVLKKVSPYHCLGYIWSQVDKVGKKHLTSTIDAVFTQLNYVISCVITTCLGDKRMKDTDRAKVVEHWIQVAMECRILKNFASLYAILSALQSKGIHQLKSTWKEVSRESLDILQMIRKNFSKENNKCIHRALFIKYESEATIPYLGTFLTDLVRVHTVKEGLLHVSEHAANAGE